MHRDDREKDPARRYKMGFNDVDFKHTGPGGDPFHKGQRRGLGVAASVDGIHWKLLDNWATESIIDGGTHWMFNAERSKYILYGRTKFQPPAEVTAWGIHGPPALKIDSRCTSGCKPIFGGGQWQGWNPRILCTGISPSPPRRPS